MQHIIRIENPCNENWDTMTPNDNGRHCDRCCKTVVDFTEWPLEAIAQYLQEKGKGNVCGHLRASQLNTPFETPETLAHKVWQTAIPLYRKIAAVIILFFAVTISSCGNNTTGTPRQQPVSTTGEPLPDTQKIHYDGDISIAPVDTNGVPFQDHSKTREPVDVAAPVESFVQGAPEAEPMETYELQHNTRSESDSTNK